jgi:hypothetical protein
MGHEKSPERKLNSKKGKGEMMGKKTLTKKKVRRDGKKTQTKKKLRCQRHRLLLHAGALRF